MKLKRLEVHGFKSFADRTEFGFEPGLTGIVGPNGCGKSNVVDAIKWVLGETRPTSLRGTEMQDVIFKGTSARPPLGFSDVTLVLERDADTDGPNEDASDEGASASVPAVDLFAEVSLTRRLFRTGESEYLLNREVVRRKDLKHLLFDTGLGVNAYSIMEQGKIDAILSANAVDRRAIFEEAAGITRFRVDRREALRRLETTVKNLESVAAVLKELERQRNSLRVQASRARRHGQLVSQLRGWRAALFFGRFLERLSEREEARTRCTVLVEEEARAREARARAEGESRLAGEESRAFASEETRLLTDLGSLRTEETRRGERATAMRRSSAELSTSSQSKRRRASEIEAELATIGEERTRSDASLRDGEARVRAAEAELGQRVEVLRGTNEAYRSAGRSLEAAQKSVLAAIEGKTASQNALVNIEAEERATRASAERLARKLEDLGAEISRLEPERQTAQGRNDETTRRMAALRSEEARIRAARDGAQTALAETESRLAEIERRLSGLQSRLAVLRDLEAGMAGVGAPAKALLSARLHGVLGLLADRVQAPVEVAPALEAALGRRAGAVVVESRDAALATLAQLRERKLGRVAMVFASGGELPSAEGVAFPSGAGVVGRLLDRVTIDPEVARSIGALLANVVVVESAADAFRWLAEFPGLVFVTVSGDRVDASGLTGGIAEPTATPISRRSTIAALEAEVSAARRDQSLLETLRERARVALVQARGDEDRWTTALGTASREATDAQVAFQNAAHRLERLRNENALVQAEAAELASRRADLESRRASLDADLSQTVDRFREAADRASAAEAEKQAAERARDAAAEQEGAARVECARLRGEQDRLQTEHARRADAHERARRELESLGVESRDEAERADRARTEAEELERSIGDLVAQRSDVEQRLQEVRALAESRAASAESAMRRERERTADLERVSSDLSSAKLAEQRGAMQCEELVLRAKDEAGIDLQEFGAVFAPDESFSAGVAEERVAMLQGKLEKIGTVSSDATSELDSIEERFAALDRQRIDLDEARASLQETIQTLDQRCLERFREAFDSIHANFADLFRKLFRGGRAEVRLAEGLDPLEAGIEIVAQPPGKKLQSITLLSGGERTLTALALLFAAFRTKPSPFCVLDEVDAALDDMNVERFLGMIEEFTKSTQFIVVTHHRRTMAACSALLGVTMPEHGVSQKVAVRFEDVDRVVPEAVGSAEERPAEEPPVEDRSIEEPAAESDPAEALDPAERDDEPVVEITPARPRGSRAAGARS